jgi:hypothetical protein
MHAARAYLFVFLSPNSAGKIGDYADLTGGVGFEYGLLYSRIKSKENVYIAHLFDGAEYFQHISSLTACSTPKGIGVFILGVFFTLAVRFAVMLMANHSSPTKPATSLSLYL